jgi:hypothetical protein
MIADPIFLGIAGSLVFSHLIAFALGRLAGICAACAWREYQQTRPFRSSHSTMIIPEGQSDHALR